MAKQKADVTKETEVVENEQQAVKPDESSNDTKNSVMKEEELKALLEKEAQSAEEDGDNKKTAYYRRKRAQEVVAAYIQVAELKAELLESGAVKPEEFTAKFAEDYLFNLWQKKAEVKTTKAI